MLSTSDGARRVLDRIFSRATKGIKLGLQRMISAAADVGNPHLSIRSIHVAGTNGKGSICAFLDAMLRGAGYSTGLYTSPHLVRFEERFLINGKPVATDEWLTIYNSFEPVIDRYDLTFFETTTLIAFELFKRNRVDWAIYETGLGGRLDATNIVRPEVAIIGAIGLDHVQYLGPDILSITGEKLGIAKARTPLIMYKPEKAEVEAYAQDYCRKMNITLEIADGSAVEPLSESAGANAFIYEDHVVCLPFEGDFQRGNALCAIRAAGHVIPDRFDHALEAIKNARLPGRFETVRIKGKHLIFDVAHNPQAAAGLVSSLERRFGGSRIRFVVGIMKDKDVAGMLKEYCRVAGEVVFARPRTPRASTPDDMGKFFHSHRSSVPYRIFESVKEAVDSALESDDGMPVCVTGSFHTVGEGMEALSICPYPGAC